VTPYIQAQLEVFRNSLPAKPYCTDDTATGLKIRSAEYAVTRRLIQPNHPDSLRWMVYDLDSPTARFDWQDFDAPPPNIMVMNRENGHAHAFYGIENPVHIRHGNKAARSHPLRYAGAIDISLTGKLQGDPQYGKLISKNPLSEHWETVVPRLQPYDLGELSDYLDLEPYRDTRKNLPGVGLGRNCTLFDNLRTWAYKEIRKEGWLNFDFWAYAMEARASGYNIFTTPLPSSEIRSTAKSISKWVWENMSSHGFYQWAENRRKKSARVRGAKSEEKAVKARYLREKGLSVRAIASELGVSKSAVSRYL
jgi:hypothetical protein